MRLNIVLCFKKGTTPVLFSRAKQVYYSLKRVFVCTVGFINHKYIYVRTEHKQLRYVNEPSFCSTSVEAIAKVAHVVEILTPFITKNRIT